MMFGKRYSVVCAASVLLLVMATTVCWSQQPAQPAATTDAGKTIAVLPWRFVKGSPKAARTGREMIAAILSNARTVPEPDDRIYSAWSETTGARWDDKSEELPTREQMLAVGNKLGVDLVIEGSARWRNRTVWVSFGPKPKSECTVNCLILDVRTGSTVLEAKDIKMDDTAKEDVVSAVGGTLLSGAFVVNVLGSDWSQHEQRAVQLAIAKALKPWVKARRD